MTVTDRYTATAYEFHADGVRAEIIGKIDDQWAVFFTRITVEDEHQADLIERLVYRTAQDAIDDIELMIAERKTEE